MNFFKFYIGDYQRDTGTLSLVEHGAYVMMLQFYYATEAPLPKGKELYRLLRAQNKLERDAIERVVGLFWQETEQGLINQRGWTEIEKGQEKIEHNRRVGKMGGRPRKTVNPDKTQMVIKAKPTHNPNQTPDTRHQNTVTKVTGALAPMEGIWGKGIELLGNAKIPEKEARAMIGKWCKAYGQGNALQAIETAKKNQAANPLPYVEKVLKNLVTGAHQKATEPLADKNYAQGLKEDGTIDF